MKGSQIKAFYTGRETPGEPLGISDGTLEGDPLKNHWRTIRDTLCYPRGTPGGPLGDPCGTPANPLRIPSETPG